MNLQAILSHPQVRTARTVIQTRDRETVEEQVRLASIPAPTGQESARGLYVRERFAELGLEDLAVDEVGNVYGRLPGSPAHDGKGRKEVLVTAHLDTIFPEGTVISPRVDGSRTYAPGITDNARGLAALLAVVTCLREAQIRTLHPLLFVATVGEEGIGDLRGVKHIFREGSPHRDAAAFISLDGAGLTRIVTRAIGACRLKATIRSLGGHSWGDRGMVNPVHALGLAIARLRAIRPAGDTPFAVNVGRVGGGTSVNAIPAEAWLELDLRSEDAAVLEGMAAEARRILEEAVRTESEACGGRTPLVLDIETIGDRPCGRAEEEGALIQAAVAATRLLGVVPELSASSTDANVPISIGVPALAMGAGGRAGGVHTVDEWFENLGGCRGIERALLTLLAVTGVHGVDQED